jgi:hypothetical protein
MYYSGGSYKNAQYGSMHRKCTILENQNSVIRGYFFLKGKMNKIILSTVSTERNLSKRLKIIKIIKTFL